MSEELEIDLESDEYKADPVAYVNKLHSQKVEGLKNKNAELLGKMTKAKPVDTSELERLRALEKQVSIKEEEDKENYQKALQIRDETHTKELEKLRGELEAERKTNTTLLIDNGISDALDSIKVMPDGKEGATAILRANAVIEDGKALIDGKPLGEYVKEWADTPQGKFFTQAPNNQGGDAPGGNNSPTTKKFSEMGSDERTALYRDNPDEYQRLRDAEQPQRKF